MMPKPATRFLPPERSDRETLQRQREHFTGSSPHRALLDAIPNALVVLNDRRQIVYANAEFRALSDESELDRLLGRRVGEALHCIHSRENGGCGTNQFCTTCGAAHAQLSAGLGRQSVQECQINRYLNGQGPAGPSRPLDLRVWASPLELDGEHFIIFAVADIAHEKRRQALEHIFFHDIANTAGNIRGLAELIANAPPSDAITTQFSRAVERLLDEIEAQRQLLAAERGDLTVDSYPIQSRQLLEELLRFYAAHPAATGRHLRLADDAPIFTFQSDVTLLGRVIGNMIKNALEATRPGGTVTLSCHQEEDAARFVVHNPGYMPRSVQLQLFNRSFSTKAPDRGLGTYSMKLLCERYLGGRVAFTSTHEDGTTFTAIVPLHPGAGAHSGNGHGPPAHTALL